MVHCHYCYYCHNTLLLSSKYKPCNITVLARASGKLKKTHLVLIWIIRWVIVTARCISALTVLTFWLSTAKYYIDYIQWCPFTKLFLFFSFFLIKTLFLSTHPFPITVSPAVRVAQAFEWRQAKHRISHHFITGPHKNKRTSGLTFTQFRVVHLWTVGGKRSTQKEPTQAQEENCIWITYSI